MTLQEMFDKVAAHLRAMPKQSVGRFSCRYRIPPGGPLDRCAIGCLMPDNVYSYELEHLRVEALPLSVREACGIVSDKHMELAVALQKLHDCKEIWDNARGNGVRESRLWYIAEDFGLLYTPPNAQ